MLIDDTDVAHFEDPTLRKIAKVIVDGVKAAIYRTAARAEKQGIHEYVVVVEWIGDRIKTGAMIWDDAETFFTEGLSEPFPPWQDIKAKHLLKPNTILVFHRSRGKYAFQLVKQASRKEKLVQELCSVLNGLTK